MCIVLYFVLAEVLNAHFQYNDNRLTGRPFIAHQLNNKPILLLSSSVSQYMTPLSCTASRRPFGQKKILTPESMG